MEYFQGHTILELLHEIQRKMAEHGIRPEEFKDRITFMSMYNDLDWTREGHFKKCVSNFIEVEGYAQIPDGTLIIPRSRN